MLDVVFWGVFWGVLGLIFGSFTNVLILRKDSGGALFGRSACPFCHRTLVWYELIPVVSFVALAGKCRTCRGTISWQYPSVEVVMSALFLLIGLSPQPLLLRMLGAALCIFLVAITLYDMRHTVIPDIWSVLFGVLAFMYGASVASFSSATDVAWYLLAGPLVALPLFCMWLVSRGRWMGFGDVKLVLSFGWLVGLFSGYVALFFAFVIGAFVGVCILLPLQKIKAMALRSGITRFAIMQKGFTMKSEVPFGPFLILGVCIVWIPSLYAVDIPALLQRFLSLS